MGEDQNQYVRYASNISDNNLNFIATLEGENGLWTPDRKHDYLGANGYYDYGFCGVNAGHHPDIYNDPRFYWDPYWQLDQCWKLYQGGTTFYAKNRLANEPEFKTKIYSRFKLTP